MLPAQVVRALSVVAVALTGWSLNVRWGAGNVRGGTPMQWERMVVGATLLAVIAAVLVWLASRPGARRTGMRAAAVVAALGPAIIAAYVRYQAIAQDLPNLVAGAGWTWLAAGAGLGLVAAAGTFAVQAEAGKPVSQKSPARRRARGR